MLPGFPPIRLLLQPCRPPYSLKPVAARENQL
jgi:hypothetical protein